MHKSIVLSLVMAYAASTFAQVPVRPDPSDPKAGDRGGPAYESAFKDYRPYSDPEPGRWREANRDAGRLGGHTGQVAGPVAPKPAAGEKPAPEHSHGVRK